MKALIRACLIFEYEAEVVGTDDRAQQRIRVRNRIDDDVRDIEAFVKKAKLMYASGAMISESENTEGESHG